MLHPALLTDLPLLWYSHLRRFKCAQTASHAQTGPGGGPEGSVHRPAKHTGRALNRGQARDARSRLFDRELGRARSEARPPGPLLFVP